MNKYKTTDGIGFNPQVRPILALDFETSDLPDDGGKPIEFGAVLLDPHTLLQVTYPNLSPAPSPTFHVFMKLEEGEVMGSEAYGIHGITREFLEANGVSRPEAKALFWKWLESHGFKLPSIFDSLLPLPREFSGILQALGQNVHFDLHFLKEWLGTQIFKIFHYKYLDTMPIADLINKAHDFAFGFKSMPFRHPESDHPSVSLISQGHSLGLEIEGAHGALFDAQLCAEIYRLHIVMLAGDLRNSRAHLSGADKQRLTEITGVPAGRL